MLVREVADVLLVCALVFSAIDLYLCCRGLPHGVFIALANMIMCGRQMLIQEVYAVCPVSLVIINAIRLYIFLAYHVYPLSILPRLCSGISSIHGWGESKYKSGGARMMGILA
jgi:hypothetical protein